MVRVWVVTGCSSGFGKEITISALARGDRVIATCRGNAQERLADLIAKGADALSLDVGAPFPEIQAFAKKAIAIHGHVDVLVNNAGYVQRGAVEETSPDETQQQFQTAVFGPLNITRAFLPQMRERRTGVIAMIGSRGADMTLPGCALYVSAKAALATATQSLAPEVEPFGIQVTCIEPMGFFTNVFINPVECANQIPAYEPVLAGTYAGIDATRDLNQHSDPKKGAECIVDLLTGTGAAKGKGPLPFRVALTEEAYELGLWALANRDQLAKDWKEWSTSNMYIEGRGLKR